MWSEPVHLMEKAKLIQRGQTIHTAPGDTARGTVLSLNHPISLNTLLTAEAAAKCMNNLNLMWT